MLIRILSAWNGSPPCGSVADVPDALAQSQINAGNAERVFVPAPRQPVIETAMAEPFETVEAAVSVKKGRRR